MSGESTKTQKNSEPRWYDPFISFAISMGDLIRHLLGGIAILGSIKVLQKTLVWLWGTEDVTFFGVRVRYIFEAADLFILVVFLWIVSGSFIKTLRKD